MGKEKNAWVAFLNQLKSDSDLSTYIGGRFYPNEARILEPDMFPCVVYDVIRIEAEEYICIPKQKAIYIVVEVHGKVRSSDKINDCFIIDELIKDAIEKDLHLGGVTTIELVDDTEFNNLDDNTRESKVTFRIMTEKFTVGNRS